MPRGRFDRDYYAVLGVSAEATDDEIRKAYRRLALQWHPDRNAGDPGAGERFKEVSEAYGVLIDPQKRRDYDAARRLGATGEFRHTREDVFRDLFANPQASAIFEELARELSRSGLRVDSRYFRQTLFGGRTVITGGVFVISPLTLVPLAMRLVRAALRGPAPVPPPPVPGGILGRVARLARAVRGVPSGGSAETSLDLTIPLRVSAEEAARGDRRRVDVGDGEVLVTIPAGITSGTRLRLRGKGRPGTDGRRGDAYLVVQVATRRG